MHIACSHCTFDIFLSFIYLKPIVWILSHFFFGMMCNESTKHIIAFNVATTVPIGKFENAKVCTNKNI